MILHELISYDVLRLIWWALLGVLLVGFAVTDGFDLGTGTLLPFVARSDVERRVVVFRFFVAILLHSPQFA